MLQPRLLTESDRVQWDRLWRRGGEPLGLGWDFPLLVATSPAMVRRIGLFTTGGSGGELVGGCHFVLRRHRFMRIWAHPAPSPWAGLLSDPGTVAQEGFLRDTATALTTFLRTTSCWSQLILHPAQADCRAFLWADRSWCARMHYNYVSRIVAADTLEVAAEGSVRRQARKAREAGLEFREGSELLPAVTRLFHATRARQGFARIIDDGALARLADGAMVVGIMRGEELLAGAIVRSDLQRSYYLIGASDGAQEEGTGAPTLLHIETTRRLFEKRGPFLWDWVGANTPSVAQFKKKFRPELEPSLRLTWRRNLGNLIGVGR